MDRTAAWRISDWAAAEFSAAIRRKALRGETRADLIPAFEAGLDELATRLSARTPVEAEDHRQARRLIQRHQTLRAPDALHLAVAQRLGAELATFDERLATAARIEGSGATIP